MLNWYLTLRNLSKTDAQAKALFELLQKAETDDEKENAKQCAQEYIAQTQQSADREPDNTEATAPEATSVEEDKELVVEPDTAADSDSVVLDSEPQLQEDTKANDEKSKIMDMGALAFNPRLAKCGITREEELFLNHVFVRKLTHEEKILMRRSIYQKKTQRNAQIQAEFRAKRIEQKQKDLNDPVKQKFHQERQYMSAIVNALKNHKNMIWMFSQIEGLTPEIVKELLQKPANANAIRLEKPSFIDDFNKVYK